MILIFQGHPVKTAALWIWSALHQICPRVGRADAYLQQYWRKGGDWNPAHGYTQPEVCWDAATWPAAVYKAVTGNIVQGDAAT